MQSNLHYNPFSTLIMSELGNRQVGKSLKIVRQLKEVLFRHYGFKRKLLSQSSLRNAENILTLRTIAIVDLMK